MSRDPVSLRVLPALPAGPARPVAERELGEEIEPRPDDTVAQGDRGPDIEPARPADELTPVAAGGVAARAEDVAATDPDDDTDVLPVVRVDWRQWLRDRVRGWAGSGSVGLCVERPPKWLRTRAATRTGLGWWLWRLLIGAELDGKQRTNASWWRSGSLGYTWSARVPSRWCYAPLAARAAARWAGTAAAVGYAVLWWEHPAAGWGMWAALVVGQAAAGWAIVGTLMGWRHRRRWVWPLHLALALRLGYSLRTPHRRYIDISRSRDRARIAVPPGWSGDDTERSSIAAVVRSKEALNQVTEVWHLTGRNHFLEIRLNTRRVPASVGLSDPKVLELLLEAPESAPLLGLTTGGAPVSVDLDSESPHELLSVGTGGGKSALVRALMAQWLRHGAHCTLLDIKRQSHRWARGLPAVDYWRDIPQMHSALVALAAEGERRNRVADDWGGDGDPVWQRHLLVIEEGNATIRRLQQWWQEVRQPGDPKLSPAVMALGDLLFMGRQVCINVILVAQYATAKALGGPEMRECFTARILGRTSRKAWAMLAPEINSPPSSNRRPGRMHVVIAGEAIETQTLFMTGAEARALATSGAPARGDVTTSQRHSPAVDQGLRVVTVTATASGPGLMTLREASSDHGAGVVEATLSTLRQARQRSRRLEADGGRGDFPLPAEVKGRTKTETYDPAELAAWERNRPNAPAIVIEEDAP